MSEPALARATLGWGGRPTQPMQGWHGVEARCAHPADRPARRALPSGAPGLQDFSIASCRGGKPRPEHGAAMPSLIYFFGAGGTDGGRDLKELLGGKGANLAEMARLGLPVPPGFTITTEVCGEFFAGGRKLPPRLLQELPAAISRL